MIIGGSSAASCKLISRSRTICEIQGSGVSSPYLGKSVTVEGIISADYWEGDPPGFFLGGRCPDQDTSAGIRVALDEPVAWLNLGDELRLEGQVAEQNYETRIQAEPESIKILSLGNPLPDPLNLGDFYLQDPRSFSYESLEGRLVSLPESLLLRKGEGEGDLLICPVFPPEISPVAGCSLGEDFYLRLAGSREHPELKAAAPGAMISNLKGILSQDQEGYLIQLVDLTAIRIRNLPENLVSPAPVFWHPPALMGLELHNQHTTQCLEHQ